MSLIRFALLRLGLRRLGPLGVALTAYDLWRRLPPKQRRKLVAHGRKHGGNALSSMRALVAARILR